MAKSDVEILLVGIGKDEKERLKQSYSFAEFVEVNTRFEAFFKLKVVRENPYLRVFLSDDDGKGLTDRNAFCVLQQELRFRLREGIAPIMEGFTGMLFVIGKREECQFVNYNGMFFVSTFEEALQSMRDEEDVAMGPNGVFYQKHEVEILLNKPKALVKKNQKGKSERREDSE